MTENRRQKLVALGAEALADAILELAVLSDANDDWVTHLVATPAENRNRFKDKLGQLLRSNRFLQGNSVHDFSQQLRAMLRDVEVGTDDPWLSLQNVAAFFEADEAILGQCDDSVGWVASVFEFDAKDVFVALASRCKDPDRVARLVLRLCEHDALGIRKYLVDCASQYLPESQLREMIDVFQMRAEAVDEMYLKRRFHGLIESIARQVSNPELFERTRLESKGELTTASLIEVAEVYLASGELKIALERLNRINEKDSHIAYQRDRLLLDIHTRLGDTEQCQVLLLRQFRAYRTTKTFDALLRVVGVDQRDRILDEEVALILDSPKLSLNDVEFLLEVGRVDHVERYLLDRVEKLNGDAYTTLRWLAKTMATEKRYLVASMIYRALVTSVLDRGFTRAYPHGVRYLKQMERLAPKIADWQRFEDHDTFRSHILTNHRRKRSFWSKYEEKR